MIYKHRNKVSGYSRYHEFASGVLTHPDPLLWLARQEDVYWGVMNFLLRMPENGARRQTRIVDLGCGLGYLTYALNKAGFDCHGIDISATAIQTARQQFGDHFTQSAIEELHAVIREPCDVIILAELIEHLPNPLATLRTCLSVLKPTGTILLTTPNKSAYPDSTVWISDPPPVHLQFFSEASIRQMAKMLDCQVDFVDFTHYNRFNYLPRCKGKIIGPPVHHVFDVNEEPIETPAPQEKLLVSLAKYLKAHRILSIARACAVQAFFPIRFRTVLCAAMSRM